MLRTCLAVLVLVAACARPSDPRDVVTVWHPYSGDEARALGDLAKRWNDTHTDVRIDLVLVPYDALADKITASIPNGNGPDLFVFAHDRIGDWAEAGHLEPIEFFVDDALADRYDMQALASLAYGRSLFGLPLAVKSVALFYRTDLVPTAPATTDDLLRIGRALTDSATGRHGLAYDNTSMYFHAAWMHGFGGRVFDEDGHPSLDSAAAREALAFARILGGPGGIMPEEITSSMVGSLFTEGRAAMAISGPWLIGSLDDGVPWRVAPLPVVSGTGRPAAPFLGSEALLMSSRARDKAAAFQVLSFLADDESALHRAIQARQVVPNAAAYKDPRVAADQVLAGFRAQAQVAIPTPSGPAMQLVWTPYDNAIQKVVAQGETPAAALAEAQREVTSYLRGTP